MAVTIKTEPKLVRPNGSHWLELEKGTRRPGEPFSKEELYPILEVDAPRLGHVRAQFQVDRYVASSYDERTGTSSPVWSDWRIYLRDVRKPDADRPDLAHLGPSVSYGEQTGRAIRDACEPIIRSWLISSEYDEARKVTAASAAKREIDAPPAYRLKTARQSVDLLADHLTDSDLLRFRAALNLLEQADALLNPPADDA